MYRAQLVLNILHIESFAADRYEAYGFNPDSLVSSLDINTSQIWADLIRFWAAP